MMDSATVEHIREILQNTPSYNAKWDVLRPFIEDLFLEQRKTVPEICQLFKSELDFSALYVYFTKREIYKVLISL
jgi:hypothetical protein